jgi:hypothetical protein
MAASQLVDQIRRDADTVEHGERIPVLIWLALTQDLLESGMSHVEDLQEKVQHVANHLAKTDEDFERDDEISRLIEESGIAVALEVPSTKK